MKVTFTMDEHQGRILRVTKTGDDAVLYLTPDDPEATIDVDDATLYHFSDGGTFDAHNARNEDGSAPSDVDTAEQTA